MKTNPIFIALAVAVVALIGWLFIKLEKARKAFEKAYFKSSYGWFLQLARTKPGDDFTKKVAIAMKKSGATLEQEVKTQVQWMADGLSLSDKFKQHEAIPGYDEQRFRNEFGLQNPVVWSVWKTIY